jgi:peptide deformylase
VQIKFLDRNGKEREIKVSGLLSTCIQHEIDHLDGVLFVDHLSNLRRSLILRKLQKFKKQQQKKAVGA